MAGYGADPASGRMTDRQCEARTAPRPATCPCQRAVCFALAVTSGMPVRVWHPIGVCHSIVHPAPRSRSHPSVRVHARAHLRSMAIEYAPYRRPCAKRLS